MDRRLARVAALLAAGASCAAVGCAAASDVRTPDLDPFREPVADVPLRCEGTRSATRDPFHDVSWSPGGVGLPIEQARTTGDVVRATMWVSPRTFCLELRLREPVPPSLDVVVETMQRHPGLPKGSETGIEIADGTALRTEQQEEGRPPRPLPVEVSAVGRDLRIRFSTRRAVVTSDLDLRRRFAWSVSTTENPPTTDESWWADDVGPVRARAVVGARPAVRP